MDKDIIMIYLLVYVTGYILSFIYLVIDLKKYNKEIFSKEIEIEDGEFVAIAALSLLSWLFLFLFLWKLIKSIIVKSGKFVEKYTK